MKAILSLFFVCFPMCLFAAEWTNKEGKVIEATFVRIIGDSVILRGSKRDYTVPIAKLSKDSQGFAYYMHKQRLKWGLANASSLIISEEILRGLIDLQPKLVEGKTYLIEGSVGSITQPLALQRHKNTTKVEITFRGGARVELDFFSQVGGRSKLKIEKKRVMLLTASSGSIDRGYSDYYFRKNLVEVGKPIIIRGYVEKGVLKASGIPTKQELMTARVKEAKRNAEADSETVVAIERIKERITFLEAKLAAGAGTGTVHGANGALAHITLHHSKEEEEAMKKELLLLKAELSAAAQP